MKGFSHYLNGKPVTIPGEPEPEFFSFDYCPEHHKKLRHIKPRCKAQHCTEREISECLYCSVDKHKPSAATDIKPTS